MEHALTAGSSTAAPGASMRPAMQSIGAAWRALAERWRARRTWTALEELDMRLLHDIGVRCSEVTVLTDWGDGQVRKTRRRVLHM